MSEMLLNTEINSQPLFCVICEDRSFVRDLLNRWLEQSLPCRLAQVTHPHAMERDHFSAKACLISARTAPYDGPILPKRSSAIPIVFDDNFSHQTALWWQERGAKGLLDFRDSPEDWMNCIRTVLDGGVAVTPTAKVALDESNAKHGLQALSRREMQVAQILVRGATAEQAAKKLGTTEGTIKNQRKAIYQKLRIERATQLAWAMGNGVGRKKS